jgi:hypothetical protein
MSDSHNPVPRLDLAPKLNRPLSLWNPLDYLRLLYWVFFFPQALRWYEDTFCGGFIVYKKMTWRKRWDLLRQNSIQRQLFLQGVVLTVVTLLVIGVIIQRIGISFNWWGAVWNLGWGVVLSVMSGVGLGVGLGLGLGVTFVVGMAMGMGVGSGVAFGVGLSVALSVALGVGSVANDRVDDSADGEVLERGNFADITKPLEKLAGVVLPVIALVWLVANIRSIVTILAAFASGFVVAILRLETWVLGLPLVLLPNGHRQFPHVTPLPLLSLSSQLANWLRRDWETGLHNANELLRYTLQFIPVIEAVKQVLSEIPPQEIIFRIAQLAEAPHNWRLVYSVSASLWQTIKLTHTKTRLNTPARATAAGFWYLHAKNPQKAVEAFDVVRSLLYGEEMLTLAQTLAAFHAAKEPAAIASMQVPAFPKEPFLRPTTWEAIASLRRVVEDMQAVQNSVSRSTRSFALNRALGELTKLLDTADIIPQAERDLIAGIAKTWRKYLLRVAGEVGEISITQPVRNPYVVGDPVQGKLFVGREDILRELEQLWVLSNQLQSVVLFGHRRMGKTSILRNTGNCLGSGVKVAYVNLLTVANASQGVAEVLMAICDAISREVHGTPPDDTKLLNSPYRTFDRYLKQVEANLEGGLIIALDEFEEIEELIEAGKIPPDFMGFLRGMVQMSPKIAFAFAGLHTLEEMTADYFHPFFASVITIPVGFLTPATARQILANPDDDFPLDYTPQALDRIYALTSGQPYLVQLIGFQLVRRYNELVFDMRRPREPVFSIDDVGAVINDELFTRGRYYFTGVWGQAARGADYQQAILQVLAPHAEGLTLGEIADAAGVESADATEALETLKRHDVVAETESRWRIVVELFRRWVLQMQAGGQK